MNLQNEIESAITEIGHGWTTPNKALILASAVIALRPKISIEVGVWAGKGMISLALAHRHIGHGMVFGIDPYSAEASVEGQENPADKEWWKTVDHEMIYGLAQENIRKYGCQNVCQLIRKKSCDYDPPRYVGILVLDGNHGNESISDIKRYAPSISVGGLLFADDIAWTGGAVSKAIALLPKMGFHQLYRIENKDENFGVFQRIK